MSIQDYLVVGTIWGIFATYMHIKLRRKDHPAFCFVLNTIGWPIATGILLYNLVKK